MHKTIDHQTWFFGVYRRAVSAVVVSLTILAFAVIATPSAHAQDYSYSNVHSFGSAQGDGANPTVPFAFDAEGNLYGTTATGGAFGYGAIYKIAVSGQESVLYSFTGIAGDGASPLGSVIVDAQGNLYGTTEYGGDLSCPHTLGCGTVFKLDTAGNETILHTFTGTGDGANPIGGIAMDAQGNLYGTTISGGPQGDGIVYKLDPSGVVTVLNLISGTGVFLESGGVVYGTGIGIFEVSVTGNLILGDLISFSLNPGIAIDAQGNFYGTATFGGYEHKKRPIGSGYAFRMDSHGNVTILHEFCGAGSPASCPDGAWPYGGLVIDSAGNLYGMTSHGGKGGNGLVFMMDPSTGNETVLHNFMSQESGPYRPMANLAIDGQGNLYGTTQLGGSDRGGSAFEMLTPAAATALALTSTPNPSTSGQPVTFTALVSGPRMPVDGEVVSFMKSKTLLGTGALTAGSATFTTSTLNVGTTKVTAVYAGDLKLSGSSNTEKQVVKKAKN
jgi:uncharacterized repeat protein (TIGR03803 family)